MMHEMSNAFAQMDRISGQNAEVALPKALATRNYYIDGRGRSLKDANQRERERYERERRKWTRGARAKTNCPCLHGKANAQRDVCTHTHIIHGNSELSDVWFINQIICTPSRERFALFAERASQQQPLCSADGTISAICFATFIVTRWRTQAMYCIYTLVIMCASDKWRSIPAERKRALSHKGPTLTYGSSIKQMFHL